VAQGDPLVAKVFNDEANLLAPPQGLMQPTNFFRSKQNVRLA